MKLNITFNCANGTVKLQDCARIPSKKDLEKSVNDFDGLGLGELKQIVIDVKA
jgi:hypothetical protein